MPSIIGKITARILKGLIPNDAVNPPRGLQPPPKSSSVRHGSGKGVGKGSGRKKGK